MNKSAAYEAALQGSHLWASEESLIKSASAEDIEIYDLMCKVASEGNEEEIYALLLEATEAGLDKEGGLLARGMSALGKGLSNLGQRVGSKSLTMSGAKMSRKGALSARKSYDSAS
jgi:hypothetical protein